MKFAPAVISLALTLPVDLCAETVQCLPEYVKPTDVVSTRLVQTDGGTLGEKITVEQKLTELKANCKNGKLVDGARFISISSRGAGEIRRAIIKRFWSVKRLNW